MVRMRISVTLFGRSQAGISDSCMSTQGFQENGSLRTWEMCSFMVLGSKEI